MPTWIAREGERTGPGAFTAMSVLDAAHYGECTLPDSSPLPMRFFRSGALELVLVRVNNLKAIDGYHLRRRAE